MRKESFTWKKKFYSILRGIYKFCPKNFFHGTNITGGPYRRFLPCSQLMAKIAAQPKESEKPPYAYMHIPSQERSIMGRIPFAELHLFSPQKRLPAMLTGFFR
ncbi:hypothetical protein CDAR_502101 [Caerostris darwini]|uniref:Uncharacterized protein n=1 Tax=Caerostris darwini TaxID=1538125 RepID=A0AAV4VYU1_9ARAC|nr:hypothetical protein CDAR_502101 [Caerostris darwini]